MFIVDLKAIWADYSHGTYPLKGHSDEKNGNRFELTNA
jgi:hypothetical protein